jgi:hypothetical protein
MEQAFQGFQKGQGAVIGSALKSLNRSRTPRPRPADTASPPSSAPAATATRTARPSATGSCTSPNRGTRSPPNHTLPALGAILRNNWNTEQFDKEFLGQFLETYYLDTDKLQLRKARKQGDRYLTLRVRCYSPAKRIFPTDGAYALSAKTEEEKFRLPIAEDVAYRILDSDIDTLAPLLPPELLARFLELTDASPVRTATKLMCRRYAVEDDQDRLTLDRQVRTAAGKRMDFNVLEFKSIKPKPMPLPNLMLSPIKLSKFLWATDV